MASSFFWPQVQSGLWCEIQPGGFLFMDANGASQRARPVMTQPAQPRFEPPPGGTAPLIAAGFKHDYYRHERWPACALATTRKPA